MDASVGLPLGVRMVGLARVVRYYSGLAMKTTRYKLLAASSMDPHALCYTATYAVASNICQALVFK